MIWKTWDGEWNLELEDVAIYDIIHSQIMHEISQSKIVMVDTKNGWYVYVLYLYRKK